MTTKLSALICACALALGLTCAQADIIESVRNSGATRTQEYVFGVDSLDVANTYVLKHIWSMWLTTDGEVVGQLEIAEGGQILNATGGNRTWVMSANSALIGGTLNGNQADRTLTLDGGGFDFSLQSGTLTAARDAILLISNANLSGAGGIDVTGAGTVKITASTNGFAGSFNVTGSTLDLGAIKTASFGLSLSGVGVYANNADAAFTSLTIMGRAVASGTYTRSELLAYGASEFGQDWSAFIGGDDTYSVTVIPGPSAVIPEHGSYALLGGCLALVWVMLRRRRA